MTTMKCRIRLRLLIKHKYIKLHNPGTNFCRAVTRNSYSPERAYYTNIPQSGMK
jgi:hypothetical protein